MAFPNLLSKLFTNSGAGSKLNPGLASSLPIGAITAFSGNFDSAGHPISSGTADTSWRLCDGGDGTPDLRGRFVLGVSDGHSAGQTGGEATHTLTEAEMPAHSHIQFPGGSTHYLTVSPSSIDPFGGTGLFLGTGFATLSSPAGWYMERYKKEQEDRLKGNSKPHNNMPPYYALSFIMKIA